MEPRLPHESNSTGRRRKATESSSSAAWLPGCLCRWKDRSCGRCQYYVRRHAKAVGGEASGARPVMWATGRMAAMSRSVDRCSDRQRQQPSFQEPESIVQGPGLGDGMK